MIQLSGHSFSFFLSFSFHERGFLLTQYVKNLFSVYWLWLQLLTAAVSFMKQCNEMTPVVNQLVSGDASTSTRQKQKDLYCPEIDG